MKENLLGPLKGLLGAWEGTKGIDVAPSDNRDIEKNKYYEKVLFEDIGLVDSHEQLLYGLRYQMFAWEEGKDDAPFHEENGYWLWDATNGQVMKCFNIPRGMSIIAGGTSDKDATEFTMEAKRGCETYGILANQFLDEEFQTLSYKVKITILDENSFSYNQETILQIKGKPTTFSHTDKNVLTRV